MIATNIRKEAREALKGKWFKAIVMLFIEAVIIGIVVSLEEAIKDNSIIKPIFAILEIIIQIPLTFGLIYSFIKLKRNEEVSYLDFVKIGFENFSKSWAIFFRTLIKMVLPIVSIIVALILIGIMFAVGGVSGIALGAGQQTLGIVIVAIAIYVAAIAYAIVIGFKYVLTTYISYDNPDMIAKDIVEKSEELMAGHRGDLFVLLLSFLGWAILCYVPLAFAYTTLLMFMIPLAIILGICATIGILALGVYVSMSRVCFYDEILQLKSEKTTAEVQE